MVAEGRQAKLCTSVLEVSRSGYYEAQRRPPSARDVHHAWLTDVITQVHLDSRGTYGAPRVHAELRMNKEIIVGHNVVARLMREVGLKCAYGSQRRIYKHIKPGVDDFVDRQFVRHQPNQLWVTDITEHPSKRGEDLLRSRPRRVLPASGGLVHRCFTNRYPHDQRSGHGYRKPEAGVASTD